MAARTYSLTEYKKIYRVFVISVLSILLISQIIIQLMITSGKYDSSIISLAGQQGMLSQDISKTVLSIRLNLLQGRDNSRNATELKSIVSQFGANHYALLLGNDSLNIHADNSPEILKLFRELQPSFLAIQLPATTMAHQTTLAAGMDGDINDILGHEGAYLGIMERIVASYRSENLEKTSRLQHIEILLALITFLLITLEILFLYTPLLKHLQQRNEALQVQYDRISHFLYVISHGIRKPVANLLGLSELLTSENTTGGSTLEHIRQSTLELDTLLRDLNQELQGDPKGKPR
ncbi:MAG TPA: type IV pili methyl-accepting chemotaxis transducer N-terminal domain-containing protein [Chitinophagaceae bacterium]|nr:type IV pili methyl-accepting chemotaxis transducer N-terminal domain-containing protein [Chitinophagaceae bacterium]